MRKMIRRTSHTTYFPQQGSSGTLRVWNDTSWMVVGEAWEGGRLLNTWIQESFGPDGEAQARKEARKLNKEEE
ncbi:MAG: hypothetical protein ACPGWR_01015 [Ardenticatenaceae bacterium]